MSQVWDATKPISGTTKISELYQIIRDHNDALKSNFAADDTYPSNPTEGQLYCNSDATNKRLYKYNGAAWKEVLTEDVGYGLEVVGARGSTGALDTRLDQALNEDGTLKASTTLSPSEWTTLATGYTFTYINTTTFDVTGDQTAVYYPYRRIKAILTGSNVYSSVVSATYTSQTRVVILDAVLDATLDDSPPAHGRIEHSIIRPLANNGAVNMAMLTGVVGDTAWTNASLGAGWTDPSSNIAFIKDSTGLVHIIGSGVGTSIPVGVSTIFTLSAGHFPVQAMSFPYRVTDNGVWGAFLNISAAGVITVTEPDTTHNWTVRFDGITFKAA